MSRATSEDQLNFLLSCVKHANNGKIDFVDVAQECCIVSKGAAYAVLPKSMPPYIDVQRRAKRYERLLKGKGINPNGGPDPKPQPLSPGKVAKRNPNDDTPRARAKRRRMSKTVEKRLEETCKTSIPKPETPMSVKNEERGYLPGGGFPLPSDISISTPHESCYGLTQTDESTFNFNDFCSPEMFTHCAPDARHSSQGDQSVPRPIPQADLNAFSHAHETPRPVREELKTESKPERETVIIAD